MSSLWRNPNGKLLPGSSGEALCRVATYPCDCNDPVVNPVPPSFPSWPYNPPTPPVPGDFPADDLLYTFLVQWETQTLRFDQPDCTGNITLGTGYRLKDTGGVLVTAVLSTTPKWVGTSTLQRRTYDTGTSSWNAWVDQNTCDVELFWLNASPDRWRIRIDEDSPGSYARNADKLTGRTPTGNYDDSLVPTGDCNNFSGISSNRTTTASVS